MLTALGLSYALFESSPDVFGRLVYQALPDAAVRGLVEVAGVSLLLACVVAWVEWLGGWRGRS